MKKNQIRITFNSETGTSHRAEGKGCEDAVNSFMTESASAVGLSDGAGTAQYARIGAELTSAVAAEFAATNFEKLYSADDHSRVAAVLDMIRRRLFKEAYVRQAEIFDFNCTLLLAARAADGRAFTVHIGDGLIFGRDLNGNTRLLSRYDEQKYLNITSFVTSRQTYAKTMRLQDISGFLMMSDGVCESFMLSKEKKPRKTASMMLELAYLMPQEAIRNEYHSLSEQIRQRARMRDDISLAAMTDTGCIKNILDSITPEIRTQLFGAFRPKQNKKTQRKLGKLIEALYRPAGITASEASAIGYYHSPHIAHRHLKQMTENGIVRCENGRYYVPA